MTGDLQREKQARTGVIEVRVDHVAQLFNSLDPSPFRSRDLDDDAADYIVGWGRELPPDDAIRLRIHLPASEMDVAHERGIETALRHYFSDRASMAGRDLGEHFRSTWRYLTIGLPVLAVCLVASQLAKNILGEGHVARLVEESLIIVGWVANWKWIEAMLYDWWPLKRRRDLLARIAAADIDVVPE